jgi:hypothetical protein
MLLAACLASPARAEDAEPAPGAAASPHRAADQADPVSLIEGSADAWSVSRTVAGCYLMSPYRKGSSRLAIGRHPALGLGLFAVGFALAVPDAQTGEPVVIQADGRDLAKTGRLAAARLLFVPLAPAEEEAALLELRSTGTLWLMVRRTSIMHGGLAVGAAIAQYATMCVTPPAPGG